MPTRDQIAAEINEFKSVGQDHVRRKYLKKLHKLTGNDTVIYASSYNVQRPYHVPAQALSVSQDDIQGFMASLHGLKGRQLDLIVHSPGGSVEAADQIVQYLRAKYQYIRVIVPQNAMSAATMIACAADEIVMGKHSAIGPIDPQFILGGPSGPVPVPAHTILKDFEKAKADVAANPVLANIWAPRFASLPPGFLDLCDQVTKLSALKVESWLHQYMFKSSNPAIAKEIADFLANFDEHKTHGRPIGFDLAKSKGLVVTRLEDDSALQEAVLSVFHATMVTFQATSCVKVIENHGGKGHYVVLQVAPAQQLSPAVADASP